MTVKKRTSLDSILTRTVEQEQPALAWIPTEGKLANSMAYTHADQSTRCLLGLAFTPRPAVAPD